MGKDEKSKKGTIVGLIVGIIAFALSYYGVQQLFKKDIGSELENIALELNKQLPMRIDEYTRLDSTATKGKSSFIYYYALFDLEKSEVNLDTVNKYIRPRIIEDVKNSPELRYFRDNKVTLEYKYFDKEGVYVMEISVTPELYEN